MIAVLPFIILLLVIGSLRKGSRARKWDLGLVIFLLVIAWLAWGAQSWM